MNTRWIPLLTLVPALHAGTLYYTDFENFIAGPNNWGSLNGATTDGWLTSDATSGAQSIDLDLDPNIALGQSATIGIGPFDPVDPVEPEETLVSVLRFFNYDHTATGLPNIEINCLVAIADSTDLTSYRRDDFFITIYNSTGTPLAALRFDNQNPDLATTQFGIWREDGILQFDTQVDFSHELFFDLYIDIDLAANTWSADIEGFPLFTDETFTANATGTNINFGALAFEWDLSAFMTANFGDNFMAIDELSVRTVPIGIDPFTATGTRNPSTGQVTLDWQGNNGFDYQVEFSTDLENWHDTLPGSNFANVTTDGPMSYTDTTTTSGEVYYRVVRSESP